MIREILPWTGPGSSETGVARAVDCLGAGGVLGHPTETVYGLAADPSHPNGARQLALIKGRPPGEPFLVLIPSAGWVERLSTGVGALARRLMEVFWPGPLTLVLPASPQVPPSVRGAGETIALRLSSHPLVAELLEAWGQSLISTSANPSGQPPARTAGEVVSYFASSAPIIDLLLDGGEVSQGLPSTLVSCRGDRWEILREGAIPAGEIRAALSPIPKHLAD